MLLVSFRSISSLAWSKAYASFQKPGIQLISHYSFYLLVHTPGVLHFHIWFVPFDQSKMVRARMKKLNNHMVTNIASGQQGR
jgi:hypothetical protein